MKERLAFWGCGCLEGNEGAQARRILEMAADAGFDSIVLGRHDKGLPELVRSCGMKAYAELSCFAGEALWREFPECRPVDRHGAPLHNEDWYYGANPACESVRRKLLAEFEALARMPGIDGVWLDFIRWPCHWEVSEPKLVQTSFDGATVERFLAETGLEEPDGDLAERILSGYWEEWTRWKCGVITSFVREARETRNRVNPGAVLGLFGVPWLRDEYNGAVKSVIGQDYRDLAEHIDVFAPMAYHQMCNRPVSWILDSASQIQADTQKTVIPVIQCDGMPDGLPEEEYAAALRSVLGCSSTGGVMVFELEQLLRSGRLGVTRELFLK